MKEVRAFLNVIIYYRIFIKDYILITLPLVLLLKKKIKADIFPLFSNIPICSLIPSFILNTLNEIGIINIKERHNWEIASVFGRLHPDIKVSNRIFSAWGFSSSDICFVNKKAALL